MCNSAGFNSDVSTRVDLFPYDSVVLLSRLCLGKSGRADNLSAIMPTYMKEVRKNTRLPPGAIVPIPRASGQLSHAKGFPPFFGCRGLAWEPA